MTPNEALDWCEQFTDNLVMVNVDTKRRTLGLQAMKVCKSALEKQIPKKPVKTRREIVCPTCRTLVGSSPYCRYCGQALDWSDTE